MSTLLPQFIGNELIDGLFIHIPPSCASKCKHSRCQEYYKRLKSQHTGFYKCPFGMTSYVLCNADSQTIYTGLRVKGYYTKRSDSSQEKTCYNPVMCPEDILPLINKNAENDARIAAVDDLLHETRKLNAQIKNICDAVFDGSTDIDTLTVDELKERVTSIYVCSYMVYNRFAHFDTVLNPKLHIGVPLETVIFKKFDKMRKLLKGYLRKGVWITINPRSYYTYPVFQTFETLLFILFENAIKYSPEDSPVNVVFAEKGTDVLDVAIDSIGPYCDENELLHLSEKGFRGENAKLVDKTGQGFGLCFAKNLCEKHGIDISFESRFYRKEHGINYGHFIINLHFDKSK